MSNSPEIEDDLQEWFQATQGQGLTGRERLRSLRRFLRSKGWEWNKAGTLPTTEDLDIEMG